MPVKRKDSHQLYKVACFRVEFANWTEFVRGDARSICPSLPTHSASVESTNFMHCLYFRHQDPQTHRKAHLHKVDSTMISLAGKVVSLTGSASGMGLATAQAGKSSPHSYAPPAKSLIS